MSEHEEHELETVDAVAEAGAWFIGPPAVAPSGGAEADRPPTQAKASSKRRRRYHSPLREQQKEAVRQRIVEALVEQVWKEGLHDFSVPKVAARAGVSIRTVYRYFPTRQALLHAVEQELVDHHPEPPLPHDITDLPGFIPSLYAYLEATRAYVEAAMSVGLAREVRSALARRRLERARTQWAQALAGLDASERDEVLALLRTLAGSQVWHVLRSELGVESGAAARMMQWAVGVLVEALGFGPGGQGPTSVPWRAGEEVE